MVLFHDPSIGLKEAAQILKDRSLTVEDRETSLQVRWDDGPVLTIRLSRGPVVQQMAAEIGQDTPYAEDLAHCDACFAILIEDLENVLDEINTLIETQLALQYATGGFLFNTWNSQLSPPDA